MGSTKIRDRILESICAIHVTLFLYAAISKLTDLEKFKVQLGKSPLLNSFVGAVAIGIPVLEIGICILLIIKRFRWIGLYSSFFLMCVFSSYIIVITNYSKYIPCSCGGILENMNWGQHLYFNLLFICLSSISILFLSKND